MAGEAEPPHETRHGKGRTTNGADVWDISLRLCRLDTDKHGTKTALKMRVPTTLPDALDVALYVGDMSLHPDV